MPLKKKFCLMGKKLFKKKDCKAATRKHKKAIICDQQMNLFLQQKALSALLKFRGYK